MNWTKSKNTRSQVDKAGWALLDKKKDWEEYYKAIEVLNNWRGAHAYPLNTFQIRLRHIARSVEKTALIAQRLKRTPSIIKKLKRFKSMSLARMQDIAGCRAIVSTLEGVYQIRNEYLNRKTTHKFVKEFDYIDKPKDSGYRGIHLIYKYRSDTKSEYNGMCLEIQIRTKIQHAWATAVETVGIVTKSQLKSNIGSKDWLRYFKIVSEGFSVMENQHSLKNLLTDIAKIQQEVDTYNSKIGADKKLLSYGNALDFIDKRVKKAHYHLLIFKASENKTFLTSYKLDDMNRATEDYTKQENIYSKDPDTDVLLVSVESIRKLKQAYPNYFMDTKMFTGYLKELMEIKG